MLRDLFIKFRVSFSCFCSKRVARTLASDGWSKQSGYWHYYVNISHICSRIPRLSVRAVIIFRSICNMQEKIFIQKGHFSFFFSPTLPTFYSKIKNRSRVKTTAFSSSRFGVRVSVVPNIFTIYPRNFLKPEISETLKGSFTKYFGTMRPKFFDGKLWYPLLSIKFFDTPNFLKYRRDAHEIFRHCENKNFRQKNVIPPPPPTFSSINFFETRNFLKNSRIPLRNFSALRHKNFDWRSRYAPSYP